MIAELERLRKMLEIEDDPAGGTVDDGVNFAIDDMVKFVDATGNDRVGVVESIDAEDAKCTVRAYAESAGQWTPTDYVETVDFSGLAKFTADPATEDNSGDDGAKAAPLVLRQAKNAVKAIMQAKALVAGQYAAYMRYSEISFVFVREVLGTVAMVSSTWYDEETGDWRISEYVNPVLADSITPLNLLPTPETVGDFIASEAKTVRFAKHLRPETEGEEAEIGLFPGDFVTFETLDGKTWGKVQSVGEKVTVMVFAKANGVWEYTGVAVEHEAEAFTKTDPLPEVAPANRIMAKFKSVECKSFLPEGAEAGQEVGVIEGAASPYGNTDLGGDIVSKGAFTQTLSHHNGTFFAFQDHHWATNGLIGVTKCEDSPNALQAKLYLPLWIPHVKAVYDMVKFQIDSGNRMGLSIGYTPVKTAPGPNGARYLNEIALDEVSVTPFPMNTDAQITAVKSRKATYAKKAALWGRLKKRRRAPPPSSGSPRRDPEMRCPCTASRANRTAV